MSFLPVVGVCRNPLAGLRAQDMRPVHIGATLAELAPDTQGLLVCRVNGGPDYVHREDWALYRVRPGDVVEFVEYPQDREALRGLLQIAGAILSIYTGNPLWAISASVAANVFLPLKPPTTPDQPSPTYSVALSGNQAQPDAPIPRACGRIRVLPPFAGQPYLEYDDESDQYYYAVLVVGVGDYDVERALIDDTIITHFDDVLVSQYLAPGVQPSQALVNVITAPEVTGQDMQDAQVVGPFSACGPGLKATAIGIDIIAPHGLGGQNDDGSLTTREATWRVDYRPIDDFGAGLALWSVLGNESRANNTLKPQRWTVKYTLPSAMRVEVRVVRTNSDSPSGRDFDEIQWAGLRAYLEATPTLNPNVAHYEIVMRASEQLSQLSQRSLALILQAKCRTLNSSLVWQAATHTRNPAWWILELATSSVWGLGMADSRIDLQSFYDYSLTWDARQDRFDYNFDVTMDAWDAMQLIARAGRARVFRRYGILSIARDELATVGVTAFTARNTQPGSMSVDEVLQKTETPDGVIVQYFNNRSWTWLPIECPCPGVSTMVKPVHMKLEGITGPKHAEREGRYEAARMLYRRRTMSCVTEMQGILPAYMAPVRWMPEIYGYGQTGDVVAWDSGTRVMTLSEPPVFTTSNYLTLMRDDGTLTTPVAVGPGPTPFDVTLPASPDFTLVLDDGNRERPRFLFGVQGSSDELVKISSISDGGTTDDGAQLYSITAEIDDPRIHSADNALLPGPGEIQDPVTGAADLGGDGEFLPLVHLDSLVVPSGVVVGFSATSTFGLQNNGRAYWTNNNGVGGPVTTVISGQWLTISPVEVSSAALFEMRATLVSGTIPTGTALGSWLSMDTNRTWTITNGAAQPLIVQCVLLIEIRDVATQTVQDTAEITLYTEVAENSGGA